MTTVIFSDTHLTDKFEQRKFNYVKKIILSADQIIINGDFWESYMIDFDNFVNSKWKGLFQLLKSKKAVYIYGNHDKSLKSDKRVFLFSTKQADKIKLKAGKHLLHIEHGQAIAPAEDEKIPEVFKQKAIVAPYVFIREKIPLLLLGKKSLQQYKNQNERMKRWVKRNLTKNEILVCGHSHLSEFNIEEQYINTGFIRHGIGQYLKILDDQLELIDEQFDDQY